MLGGVGRVTGDGGPYPIIRNSARCASNDGPIRFCLHAAKSCEDAIDVETICSSEFVSDSFNFSSGVRNHRMPRKVVQA